MFLEYSMLTRFVILSASEESLHGIIYKIWRFFTAFRM